MKKKTFTKSYNYEHYKANSKAAFTLAEVLTTLMIIGVVAALTIPALMQNIGGGMLENQKKVFKAKLEEGLHRMSVEDKLGKKYTTKSFINEFKNYFATSVTCEPNNLENCFGKTIINGEDVFNVADLKNAKNFDSTYFDAPVYGVKFIDGTNMLIAYEPNCKGYASSDITKDLGNEAYEKCFKYIYDVNGEKEENTFGNDIEGTLVPTKGDPFGLGFSIEFAEISTFCPGCTSSDDYQLAAKNYCENRGGKLPSEEDFKKITEALYPKYCKLETFELYPGKTVSTYESCNSDAMTSDPLWQTITNGRQSIGLWSNEQQSCQAYTIAYGEAYYTGTDTCRADNSRVICIK